MKSLYLSIVLALALFVSSLQAFQYEVTICAIYNDDDLPYMKEWIQFHKKQGVQHIYLYNNGKPNNSTNFKRYIKKKYVEVTEWNFPGKNVNEWNKIQCDAYMDCINKIKTKTRWCAFIDTDEFLFSPSAKKLKKALKNYKDCSAVGVNWVMYGTSGVQRILPKQKMTNLLVYRSELSCEVNKHVKSIVNPRRVQECDNPHFFIYAQGFAVNENRERIQGAFTEKNSVNHLRLNHYWLRDEDFLRNIKIPRRLAWGDRSNIVDTNKTLLNKQFDNIMKRFN